MASPRVGRRQGVQNSQDSVISESELSGPDTASSDLHLVRGNRPAPRGSHCLMALTRCTSQEGWGELGIPGESWVAARLSPASLCSLACLVFSVIDAN